jgi:hypothetical protein
LKRLIALVAGAFGVRALLRRRGRRSPPVDELRAKLAGSRTVEPPAPPEPAPPKPAPEAEPDPVDEVDGRRADVHERARRSIDELS